MDDVVVVVVEDHGDVELLADGEEVMDGPDLISHQQLFQNPSRFLEVLLTTSSFSRTSLFLTSSDSVL